MDCSVAEARSLRHLPGALARGRPGLPGPEEEHGQGRGAGEGPVLRPVDPRPVHEAGGGQRGLDAHVSQRVSRAARGVGRGVREALLEVSLFIFRFIFNVFVFGCCFFIRCENYSQIAVDVRD